LAKNPTSPNPHPTTNNNTPINIGAVISDRQKVRNTDDAVDYISGSSTNKNLQNFDKLFNSDGTPNTETFDNLPHIRKAVDNKSYKTAEVGYGNDTDSGAIDLLSNYQKTRTGVETGIDYAETGICYIFITKPDLNLRKNPGSISVDERKNISMEDDSRLYNTLQNSFIEYIAINYPDIIDSITCNKSTKNNFIPLLFNHFRSFSLEDHNMTEGNYSETWRGYSQKLPTTAAPSFNGGNFSITYDETNPPLITFLHKVWFEYMEAVKFNQMMPSMDSINRREIDYTASLYYFLLAPDGETIVFWGKYTGIFPQNVPYSSFSSGDISSRNLIQVTINYVYNHKEFLDPAILVDFNDTFMDAEDIMKARENYKGDIMTIHDMEKFQEDLIKMTGASDNYIESRYGGDNTGMMYENKSNKIYLIRGSNLERRTFNGVGVFKKDKRYKLIFYNN